MFLQALSQSAIVSFDVGYLQRTLASEKALMNHWEIPRLRVIPTKIFRLIARLYIGANTSVKRGGGLSSFIPVNSGAMQGCVLLPTLFNTCMDCILGRATIQGC